MLEILDGVHVVESETHHVDARGVFIEPYNQRRFAALGLKTEFVEDDFAVSHAGVLRGFHGDFVTHRLVWSPAGSITLALLDCRLHSETMGEVQIVELNDSNRAQQFLLPPGVANAYLSRMDSSVLCYKKSEYYDDVKQFTVDARDPALQIPWNLPTGLIRSERDLAAPTFATVFNDG